MHPQTLDRYGSLAYGAFWIGQLAADLGVSERTIHRWRTGAGNIPERQAEDIRALCLKRAQNRYSEIATLYRQDFRARVRDAKQKAKKNAKAEASRIKRLNRVAVPLDP